MPLKAAGFALIVSAMVLSPAAFAAGAESGAGPRQLLAEGDRAAAARNFDLALTRYRAVIADDPRAALAHYRIGQVQAIKGELNEAEQAYLAALRFAGTDDALRAKLLFCIGTLRERQGRYDAAVEAWTEYEKLAVNAPATGAHVRAAAERKNRIAEWKKSLLVAAETRARSTRRASEREALTRKNAK
jgi:tetratricopeptide (TPR) repeat protein